MRKPTPDMMLDEVRKMDTVQLVVGSPSTKLALKALRVDGGTQPRAEISQKVVSNYAEDIADGANFPLPVVFYDGKDYWVGDGFHRIAACTQLGLAEIFVEVHQGTQRDAVLYSVGANSTHGLPRTDADKHRAVKRMLEDPEWSQWSDREIGRRCNVSATFVASLRKSYLSTFADSTPVEQRKVERNGKTYIMDTAKIGMPVKSEWAPLTWAVYDWATTKAGQPIQSLKDIQYFKEKDQKWLRLTSYLKAQGFLDIDKGSVLTACSTVLRALREESVPQRVLDTESVCPDTEPEPVMMMLESVAVRIGSSVEAPVVVVETTPVVNPSTNGKAQTGTAVHHDTYTPSHLEVRHGSDGRKIIVSNINGKRELWLELLPEQASWLAGELLS